MARALAVLFGGCLVIAIGGILTGFYFLLRLSADLPGYDHLARYEPPVMTRMHAGDGSLIAEYARERRLFVPVEVIPAHVVNAFLAAEDAGFYEHPGIDARGVARAVFSNVGAVLSGRRLQGASTITQQVAKNFLLSSDITLERKVKEAVLALRLEKTFTKPEILELYLNEIYLGLGSYGVAAAALNYFDKSLNQLSIDEAAYLAALPKAPNNYHPFRKRKKAIARRNWVIGRMLENGFISSETASGAREKDLIVKPRAFGAQIVDANYFVEEVRRELYDRYGEERLYEGGLSVRTTLDTDLQKKARKALRDGLIAYDQRHGWRGVVSTVAPGQDWQVALAGIPLLEDLAPWTLGVVTGLTDGGVEIGLRPDQGADGVFSGEVVRGFIALTQLEWALKVQDENNPSAQEIRLPEEFLKPGDIVYVAPLEEEGQYALRQIPQINGAIVVLDPHTGRVLAMEGGFSFELSEFNRVVQARRQPGSAFKPFVYAAALDRGFTPSSLVLDAPFVIDQGPGQKLWKPENYGHIFYGPSTLRLGIEKSRNLMTVRLAQNIGMRPVVEYARKLGIVDNMPPVLSMALGAGETTLLRMAAAYGMLVNGGRRIQPTFIDRVQDRRGRTIYRHDTRLCEACDAESPEGQLPPQLPDLREQVLNPQTAFQVVSMLEGVVRRGTGRAVYQPGLPLAGKTGTTNDERDAWFVGFSPNMVVGVFAGFDEPVPMGKGETGARVAAPVFRQFMKETLGGAPGIPFRIPPGIQLIRVNARTGELARAVDKDVVLEAFKEGVQPHVPDTGPEPSAVIQPGPSDSGLQEGGAPGAGTGGLY